MGKFSSNPPVLLLVENSEDHAILFQRIFNKIAPHWQLVWVKDGSAAVHTMVYDSLPHLLVIGLQTPRLDAKDVIEWVRSMKCCHSLSVLIFDGTPNDELRRQLAGFGVTNYLDKRSPAEKFRQVLTRLVAETELSLGSSEPAAPAERRLTPGFARTHPI